MANRNDQAVNEDGENRDNGAENGAENGESAQLWRSCPRSASCTIVASIRSFPQRGAPGALALQRRIARRDGAVLSATAMVTRLAPHRPLAPRHSNSRSRRQRRAKKSVRQPRRHAGTQLESVRNAWPHTLATAAGDTRRRRQWGIRALPMSTREAPCTPPSVHPAPTLQRGASGRAGCGRARRPRATQGELQGAQAATVDHVRRNPVPQVATPIDPMKARWPGCDESKVEGASTGSNRNVILHNINYASKCIRRAIL